MIAYAGRPDQPSVPTERQARGHLTTTVCDYAFPPHILQPFLFYKPAERVECPSCFEGTYALLVLTLEEQLETGPSRV